MSTTAEHDVILLGGGLANGLIAWRLATARPAVRILMLEQAAQIGGNHTWSFHDGDLDAAQQEWLAPLVSSRWPRYQVIFPERTRMLDSGYASVTSADFARVVGSALGDRLRTGVQAEIIDAEHVRLADGRVLRARVVIDGRGPAASSRLALGHQTFLGQELRLRAPHGLAAPIIMDASVAQQDGYRFVYVLPFAEDRLLIADTHYVDHGALPHDRLRANIAAYAGERGWQVAEVLREEHGSLPIVMAGDFEAFWADAAGQPRSGLRAGLFHPTTGYSLPHAVRLAERVAALPRLDAHAVFDAIHGQARAQWHDQRFFRLLNRMLFLAGQPNDRWRVMQRFYGLPEPLIARFYAGRLRLADKLRILAGKPPVPVAQAWRAARLTHPSMIRTPPNDPS